MLKLNPRHVHFVHLTDGTKEGTDDVAVEGFNDQLKDYVITLRGIGGPSGTSKERSTIKHIQILHALDEDAPISYKYGVLLSICNFVATFFEPHYEEE